MSDCPAYLPSGTEVSAKFKGAFCEAKVKKVIRSVKIKITLKEAPFGNIYLEDGAIPATAKIELNEAIEIIHNGQSVKGVIVLIKDCSKYQVVFNDGDEKELRRTQLCLKSGKHFDTAVNLDALPLYNPEQFGSPVIRGVNGKSKSHKKKRNDESSSSKKKKRQDDDSDEDEEDDESDEEVLKKRERRAAASAATVAIGEMDQGDTHSDESSAASSEGLDFEAEEKERIRRDLLERDREEKQRKIQEEREKKFKIETEKLKEKEKQQKEKEKLKEKEKQKEKEVDRPKVTLSPDIKKQYHLDQEALSVSKCVIVFEDLQSASRIRDSIATAAAESMIAAMTGNSVPYNPPVASASAFPGPSGLVQRLSIPNQVYPFFYKRQWWPAVIVSNLAYQQFGNRSKNPEKGELTLRRFSDGRYLTRAITQLVPFAWMPMFSKKKMEEFKDTRSDGSNVKDKFEFTVSLEMAFMYSDNKKLPKTWTTREILGKEEEDTSNVSSSSLLKEVKKVDDKKPPAKTATTNANSSESEASSDESDNNVSSEERDLFIAKLYKFHEDSASPINRVPVLGGREIDMYLFHKLVQKYGGAKRVTANNEWNKILSRLKLHGCPGANSVTLKKSYSRYLEPYCNFEAKLGWSFDGKAAELSGTSSRVERRLVRPGQISELEKKKKQKVEEKPPVLKPVIKDREEVKQRDSKEGSVVESIISTRSRSIKSESPGFPAITIEKIEGLRTRRSTSIESSEKSLDLKRITKEKVNDALLIKKDLKREYSATKDKEKDKVREKRAYSISDGLKKEKYIKLEDPSDYGDEMRKAKELKKAQKPKTEKQSTTNSNSDGPPNKNNPDERFVYSNLVSHFYMGQRVRALHNGRWYDARVLEIRQPKYADIINLLLKGDDPKILPETSLVEIKEMVARMKCFVHYLGWNARYDEWIPLSKLKLLEKDQQSSRISLREQQNGKFVPDYRIALAEVCCFTGEEEADFTMILKNVKESSSKLSRSGYNNLPSTSSNPSTSLHFEKERKELLSTPSTSANLNDVSPASNKNLLLKNSLSPISSLQSMTDSALSSALRTTSSGLPKFSLTSFMSHMKSNADPKLTVRAVAAAAVGLEARSRGSRLLLSPPGGRSQKTLLHQVSSEAGFQALRNDPLARLEMEKREQANAVKLVQACTLSTQSLPSSSTPKKDVFPVATEPPIQHVKVMPSFVKLGLDVSTKRITPPKEKESLRKSRAAAKQAEAASMTRMIEGLMEDPRRMMQGVMMAAEKTQEAHNRNMKNAALLKAEDGQLKNETQKSDESEKVEHEPPAVTLLNEVKKELIERTGQDRFIGDYDITRKSSRKSTIAASTASINALKVPTVSITLTPSPPLPIITPTLNVEKPIVTSVSVQQPKEDPPKDITPTVTVDKLSQEEDIKIKEEMVPEPSKEPAKPDVKEPVNVKAISPKIVNVKIEQDEEGQVLQPTKSSSRNASSQLLKPSQKKKQPIRQAVIATEKKKNSKSQENLKKKDNSDDDDYSEFFSNHKTDTFNQMKTKMQKQMETNNTAYDFRALGLPDFEKLIAETPKEDLMDVLEQRCQDLREIYNSSKTSLVTLERSKKKFLEQKRYRDRKRRSSPSFKNAVKDQPSTSSSSCRPSTSSASSHEYEPEL